MRFTSSKIKIFDVKMQTSVDFHETRQGVKQNSLEIVDDVSAIMDKTNLMFYFLGRLGKYILLLFTPFHPNGPPLYSSIVTPGSLSPHL